MAEKQLALVVDDTEVHRSLIKMGLSSRGYAVTTALDGQEGLARCKEAPFSLLFSDFELRATATRTSWPASPGTRTATWSSPPLPRPSKRRSP